MRSIEFFGKCSITAAAWPVNRRSVKSAPCSDRSARAFCANLVMGATCFCPWTLADSRDVDQIEKLIFPPSPAGGGSRTAGARVRGGAGIRSALRALSPQPVALRAPTFPLQGKVKKRAAQTLRSRMRRRCLMAIEPDAGEVAEQRHEFRPIGLRQRRLEQRGDIGAQMRGVAGAEQHDVDARLMARKPVGGLDHVGGAGLM